MQQKLFNSCGLLRITNSGKSNLYKVPENISQEPFELETLPYLPEAQSVLEVYPEANLLLTQEALMTLDGKIILQQEHNKISVVPIGKKWMIVQDSMQNNDLRYRIMFWDGTKEREYIWGRFLIYSEKYLAVYTSGDKRWCVYSYDDALVLDVDQEQAQADICGDFLVTESIGNYAVYSLRKQDSFYAKEHCIFAHQQLIIPSAYANFVLCANLQSVVQVYFEGVYSEYGKAEMIELYDRAGLFTLKRGGKFFLYRLNGESYGENICPCGADLVAYDEDENTLLIGVNGSFRLLRL